MIYKGQKLEADIAYIEIYQQAKKSIYVIDDYMNAKSLQHLSQKADGVEVVLFTENGKRCLLFSCPKDNNKNQKNPDESLILILKKNN